MAVKVPKRWHKHRFHPKQALLMHSLALFIAVWAGRRSGKTETIKRKIVRAALGYTATDDGWFVLSAPTHAQAKRIFWQDLKRMIPKQFLAGRPSESELTVRLITGTEITVLGLDQPARIEGRPLNGINCDEFASMKPGVWEENVLPALTTPGRPQGFAILSGVPEGRNHFYDIAMDWMALMKEGDPDHLGLNWPSADVLDPKVVAKARRELDELTFRQEFLGDFINFAGRAYVDFTRETHCAPLEYAPSKPLVFCFDFNVSPGVAVVAQEGPMKNPLPGVPADESVTQAIGEVHIKHNSNTRMVCRRLIKDWGKHPGKVLCYGDATGGADGTAAVAGSDVELIEQTLRPVFGDRLDMRFARANPRERQRVNAVNSRIKSIDDTIRLVVDPVRAPELVKDFEGVVVVDGGSGELDKKTDPSLTHLTDAFGYYIFEEFPLAEMTVSRYEL